jgi:hypothetical protein
MRCYCEASFEAPARLARSCEKAPPELLLAESLLVSSSLLGPEG